MTQFNFDLPVERQGTACEKWDGREKKFGQADVIPLWIADMDFAAAPCIQEALATRLEHGVLGYSFADDALYAALHGWFSRRYGWAIDPAHVTLTPGVVPALFAAIQGLTEAGDGIIVPTPVYPPFFAAVKQSGRRLITSPLKQDAGRDTLDFELLEQQAQQGAKLLLLCNPHNPVGRVWRLDELQAVIDLALRYDLVVVSDDIHCDLTYPGETYIPLATLAPPELRLITAVAPSKTFNIAGLGLSAIVCQQLDDQRALQTALGKLPVNPCNPLSMAAFSAAYAHGGPWLHALMDYLTDNRQLVMDTLANLPQITCQPPQATYLMWLDCRGLHLNPRELDDFFLNQAKLGLNNGQSYGEQEGYGFMRINIGTQRKVLKRALGQLVAAVEQL